MKPFNQWTFAQAISFAKSVEKKTWMIVLSSVAGFVLVLVFLIIPAWIDRPMLRQDIQGMEAQIRQVNVLDQKRSIWEENQKVYGLLIEKTQERVFTANDLGLLLGQVSKMAEESGVDVLASKPLTEKTVFPAPYNLKYQPSGYEFTVQGGYHDLGGFVSRIESYGKLLRIQSIMISPDEKVSDRHIAKLKLWAIQETSPKIGSAAGASHVQN